MTTKVTVTVETDGTISLINLGRQFRDRNYPGATCTIVGYDHGRWLVERVFNCQVVSVFMTAKEISEAQTTI